MEIKYEVRIPEEVLMEDMRRIYVLVHALDNTTPEEYEAFVNKYADQLDIVESDQLRKLFHSLRFTSNIYGWFRYNQEGTDLVELLLKIRMKKGFLKMILEEEDQPVIREVDPEGDKDDVQKP